MKLQLWKTPRFHRFHRNASIRQAHPLDVSILVYPEIDGNFILKTGARSLISRREKKKKKKERRREKRKKSVERRESQRPRAQPLLLHNTHTHSLCAYNRSLLIAGRIWGGGKKNPWRHSSSGRRQSTVDNEGEDGGGGAEGMQSETRSHFSFPLARLCGCCWRSSAL